MIDPEIQILLDQKQDIILPGIPVPRDGQLGDLRTNVAHKGKFFQVMKTGEAAWYFSAPFTQNPPSSEPVYLDFAKRTYGLRSLYNGSTKRPFNALVTSDGSIVTMTLTNVVDGDIILQFSDGDSSIASGSTIELTAGSDASPTDNFIYILKSDKILTKSTSAWPSAEHNRIVRLLVPSAGFVQTNGVYINQNWNDFLDDGANQGHLIHMAERSRRFGARYFSGVDGNGSEGYLTPTAGNVELKSTAGVVYQMHKHTVPAFDTSGSDIVLVKNWNGDAYHDITNLYDITKDSGGITIGNNKYFNLVIWGVANKSGEFAPMMINLPSGFYNTESGAKSDLNGNDDFSIPGEFARESSTGFLIARITIQMKTGGGTWVVASTVDLRGFTPQSATGGVASPETQFADNVFEIFDESDPTKEMAFDVGTLVATGNKRTLQIPNVNGIIALSGGGQFAIEGLATGRNVIRTIQLIIAPGATPGTNIDVNENSATRGFNAPSVTDATDLAKSGSSGSFLLDATGGILTMDITETIIGIISSTIMIHDLNSSSTSEMYTLLAEINSGNMRIELVKRGTSVTVDWTSVMDAGDLFVGSICFVTST